AAGRIGFDETRAVWRQCADEHATHAAMSEGLHSRLGGDVTADCGRYVLLLAGETPMAGTQKADGMMHRSAVLLSDRTGLPFGALPGVPAYPLSVSALQQDRLSKPFVHLLARLPEAG